MKAQFALLAVGISGVYALPSPVKTAYSLKERHEPPVNWIEVGQPSKDQTIHLQIGLKQQNEGVIESHLLEISDPKHIRYGQHLSGDEVRSIVAPKDETIDLVTTWLREHEIDNAVYSPGKDWMSIVVTIEKAEKLLQTKYSIFEHSHDGTTLSRTPEWSLPLHLHEHIDVVQPTNSFFRPTAQASLPLLDGGDTGQTWFESEGKAKYVKQCVEVKLKSCSRHGMEF